MIIERKSLQIASSKFSLLDKLFAGVTAILFATSVAAEAANGLDRVNFGDRASEQVHELRIKGESEVYANDEIEGVAGRRLLPPENGYIDQENNKLWGNSLFITMKVDSEKQNYFTARFWGGEWGSKLGRLVVLADGKLLSHTRHGDLEPLDTASTRSKGGPFPGRFYYSTVLLPESLTEGQESIELEIRHFGTFYTNAFRDLNKMYYPVDSHSKTIYNAYTHTNSFFQPPGDEKQGEKPPMPRRADKLEQMEQSYQTRRKQLINRLENNLEQMAKGDVVPAGRAYDLAKAYHIKWLPFYQNKRIPGNILNNLDYHIANGNFKGVRGNPAGTLAETFLEMKDHFRNPEVLNAKIESDDAKIRRRELYADAFVKAQKSQLSARRAYTNQATWSDGHIYQLNLALEILAPDRAMEKKDAQRIVLEMVGLLPWTGSWKYSHFPDDTDEMAPLFTDKAQGRELGFVAGYGEAQGWVGRMARFCEDAPRLRAEILKQAHRVLEGRTYLRYPHWDKGGYMLMRGNSVVSCRHTFYPGRADNPHSYCNLATVAQMAGDELAIELVHRSIMEGQPYDIGAKIEDLRGWRYYRQWLEEQENKEAVMELPIEGEDFVWADEDNALLVFKHGNSRAYINFMFANPGGVNSLARIQYTTPVIDRLATVRVSNEVEHTGDHWLRGDTDQWITGQEKGPWAIIPELKSYWGGEKLPIAEGRIPGLAKFYEVRYGDYYIVMNTTGRIAAEAEEFEVDLSSKFEPGTKITVLGTGKIMRIGRHDSPRKLGPHQTKVLYIDED